MSDELLAQVKPRLDSWKAPWSPIKQNFFYVGWLGKIYEKTLIVDDSYGMNGVIMAHFTVRDGNGGTDWTATYTISQIEKELRDKCSLTIGEGNSRLGKRGDNRHHLLWGIVKF